MGDNAHEHNDGPVDWDGKVFACFLVSLVTCLLVTWFIIT